MDLICLYCSFIPVDSSLQSLVPESIAPVQASVWATPWTALQADFTKGPISAQMGNYKATGCPAVATMVASAAPTQCAGPWNAILMPAQMAAYKTFSTPLLIVDYGWDKA